MNNFVNPYYRLNFYLSFFADEYALNPAYDNSTHFGKSIIAAHKSTEIPLSVIRNDIINIYDYWPAKPFMFDFDNTKFRQLASKYDLEELFSQDKLSQTAIDLIINGELDDIPIFSIENDSNSFQIPVTSDEYRAYFSFNQNVSERKTPVFFNFEIKDSYRFMKSDQLIDNIICIKDAISKGCCLNMEYLPPNNKVLKSVFKPLKIIYDSIINCYAVLTIQNDVVIVYRLDRIEKLELDLTKIQISNTEKINIYPNVWGMNFNSSPEKVKIRFYDEGNVWLKVRADLSYRTNGSLYEKNGFLYYEDIVYGIESFRSWLYGFGSSAIVIKPESLRNQIIDSLNVRKERLSVNNHQKP